MSNTRDEGNKAVARMTLHSGAYDITREALSSYPVPNQTDTYAPVPHGKLMDEVHGVLGEFGLSIVKERYAVQDMRMKTDDPGPGARMFSTIIASPDDTVDTEGDMLDMALAVRNSYDKSIAVGVAAGSHVFVCDNLILSGEINATRKHTPNVWNDIFPIIRGVVAVMQRQHTLDEEMRHEMKGVNIDTNRGLDLLGSMAAHGDLPFLGGSASMFGLALREWREPTYEEFHDRNLWSLFNACTFATKKSSILQTMLNNALVVDRMRRLLDPKNDKFGVKAKELNGEILQLKESLKV